MTCRMAEALPRQTQKRTGTSPSLQRQAAWLRPHEMGEAKAGPRTPAKPLCSTKTLHPHVLGEAEAGPRAPSTLSCSTKSLSPKTKGNSTKSPSPKTKGNRNVRLRGMSYVRGVFHPFVGAGHTGTRPWEPASVGPVMHGLVLGHRLVRGVPGLASVGGHVGHV